MSRALALLVLAGCHRLFGLDYIDPNPPPGDAADAPPPDLTNSCGVPFHPKADYQTGVNPYTVTLADLDNQNGVDILVANMGPDSVSILINNGNGIFSPRNSIPLAVNSDPLAVAAVHLDGDAFLDIVVILYGTSGFVTLPGNGDGTFGQITETVINGQPMAIATGNLDNNSFEDVAIVSATGVMRVYYNNGSGTFGSMSTFTTGSSPRDVALADVTNDGKLDAVITHYGDNTIDTFRGTDSGFDPPVPNITMKPQRFDLGFIDGDGNLDAVVGNDVEHTIHVMLGNGTGQFATSQVIPIGSQAFGAVLGRLGSGMQTDMVISQYSTAATVLLADGDGAGRFAGVTPLTIGGSSSFALIGDVDNQPPLDIVTANYTTGSVSVLLGCR